MQDIITGILGVASAALLVLKALIELRREVILDRRRAKGRTRPRSRAKK